MKDGLGFVSALMRARPLLILGLSAASGYTTYNGLALFVVWPIAFILTFAVQSIIVIATIQLTKVCWNASALRFLSIFSCLLVTSAVSVFFLLYLLSIL